MRSLGWANAAQLLLAAVIAAIVGDVALLILTGDFFQLSGKKQLKWLGLLGLAYLIAAGLVDGLVGIFKKGKVDYDVHPMSSRQEATPALIVMASASSDPSNGPHWTAFRQFVASPVSTLSHVFVIHSNHTRSLASARALVKEINDNHSSSITGYMDGLDTDFENPEAIFNTAKAAIAVALAKVEKPENITLDATGGTSMASVGAALAKLDNQDINLSYIPNNPDSTQGTVVKRVDLSAGPMLTSVNRLSGNDANP